MNNLGLRISFSPRGKVTTLIGVSEWSHIGGEMEDISRELQISVAVWFYFVHQSYQGDASLLENFGL